MNAAGQGAVLRFSDQAHVSVRHVGHERQPVIVIDHASGHAAALRDFAATQSRFAPAASVGSGYPGLLGPAPVAYVDAMVRYVLPLIAQHFTGKAVVPARARGNFSLVTTPADALGDEQRVPHVDTADVLQFATVHFLSPDNGDGTAFFRHRATGYETITAERLPDYRAARDRDPPPPPGYCTGDSAAFAQIDAVPAAFDRLVLYRAALLHSGQIFAVPPRAAEPLHGRLTGNLFLQCRIPA